MKTQNNTYLNNTQLQFFSEQIALLLHSGISSIESLTILAEDASENGKEQYLTSVLKTFEETGNLSEALEKSQNFPSYFVQMVKIGENTGALEEVMTSLSQYYKQRESLSIALKNAVSYPFIMIGFMVLLMIVLITKVLPVFQDVLSQLGASASGITTSLIHAGTLLQRNSLYISLFLLFCIFLGIFLSQTQRGKTYSLHFFSNFFLTRTFLEKVSICQFASTMALLLKSGFDSTEGIVMTYNLISSPLCLQKMTDTQKLMDEGENFPNALKKVNLFTGVYSRMLLVSYKTGNMDEVMEKISLQYEQELEESLGNLISRIEPTLVVILSILVGFILLSVMLPLLSIMANIG